MTQSRRDQARDVRIAAAQLAAQRSPASHTSNGEEYDYRDADKASLLASYTKGLPHDPMTGLVANSVDFELMVTGIQSSDPADFRRTPLGPDRVAGEKVTQRVPDTPSDSCIGPKTINRTPFWHSAIAKNKKGLPEGESGARVRAWESAGAGNVFDLQGPDAQAVTMPPAPRLESDELLAEMAEVYAMALTRDVPFSDFPIPTEGIVDVERDRCQIDEDQWKVDPQTISQSYEMLANLPWFTQWNEEGQYTLEEVARRRSLNESSDTFRGVTPGERTGPYLSQFLLGGNRGFGNIRQPADGKVAYGSIEIDLRVRTATPRRDYMTTWASYLDVQNGADLRGEETYVGRNEKAPPFRFIATPRDLATYVHHDALYEAYLNACIFMLSSGAPFDPGIPFIKSDTVDRQQGFAHFGGPHILTLVCEVATRALKAVRFQKFNVHRRLRPEAVGGRVDRWMNEALLRDGALLPLATLMGGSGADEAEFEVGLEDLYLGETGLLEAVRAHNSYNNGNQLRREPDCNNDSYLLPMAFPEGSPMHPSYGAGHGTVAGACVTILKAYFDHGWTPPTWFESDPKTGSPDLSLPIALFPTRDGQKLQALHLESPLTIEGELNKLAANIAIGRNWAGVHYYSDYIESMRLGESIAIGLLEEQKLTYPENFSMTLPLFDGGSIRI